MKSLLPLRFYLHEILENANYLGGAQDGLTVPLILTKLSITLVKLPKFHISDPII